MTVHQIAIAALAGMFLIATLWPINMGILAFIGAFLIGTLVAGFTASDIASGLPSSLFLTLAGITWLFALAQNNGTIDWIVRLSVRAVDGRVAAIPWLMFLISGVLTSVGAISAGAVAIVAPIALGFAASYKISPMLMGLMVVHGAQAGAFSPISVFGGITNRIVEKAGLPLSPLSTFSASIAVNLGVAILLYLFLGGRSLIGRRITAKSSDLIPNTLIAKPASGPQIYGDSETEAVDREVSKAGGDGGISALSPLPRSEDTQATPYQLFTLGCLILLVLLVTFFGVDIGFLALTLGGMIALVNPMLQRGAVGQIAWPEIMLICGVSTYIAVMDKMGTIDLVGQGVAGMASPMLAALLLFYIGAIVSAFASSSAVLGSAIPLAVPFLQADSGVGAIGFIAGMAVASTIVDVSPFSTNGALVLANTHGVDRLKYFRYLLGYGGLLTLVAPPALWVIFVLF